MSKWDSSDLPWSEFERRLSGKQPLVVDPITIEYGDGSDTPPWMRSRPRYEPPPSTPTRSTVDYAELHCHSNFSFLDGASHPEELAETIFGA
jgi:error-prone DNA polymerase